MNKTQVCQTIIVALRTALKLSQDAAEQARKTATDKENVAENKYDTLGLEAAYLAHGQSNRVVELNRELALFCELEAQLGVADQVQSGALLLLEDDAGCESYLMLGPSSGGLKVNVSGQVITVVTPESPLGNALLGLAKDDEVSVEIAGKQINYVIANCW